MGWRSTAAVAVVVGAMGFGAGSVFSQDKAAEPLSAEEMMKINEAKAALGDEHKKLAKWVGSWDADGTFWMDPKQKPGKTKGTSKFSALLGGRYLLQEYAADFLGRPFEGRGIFGFDKEKKKHFTLWIDNTRTGFEIAWEIEDGKRDVLTYMGEDQEWEGVRYKTKETLTPLDDDHVKFERYEIVGEQESKQIEILYTRRK